VADLTKEQRRYLVAACAAASPQGRVDILTLDGSLDLQGTVSAGIRRALEEEGLIHSGGYTSNMVPTILHGVSSTHFQITQAGWRECERMNEQEGLRE